mgnify:CR=1 FL=1
MHRNIAFIGLGAMGGAMAQTLAKKQYRVTGYDMHPEAVARLASHGGFGAASAEEAAKDADLLILMVVNADQAENVLFERLALEASKPDATVIVCSTCAPDRIEAMARRVTKTGRHFIDAPVSGGVAGAVTGTLTIMAAARKDVFEKAKPVLAAMGSSLFHLGERPGQGAAMKVVNQLLCGVHIAVAAEGLAFAERAGIATPSHELLQVGGKAVLLSRRFDRVGAIRIPFLSAMAMTGSKDGERGSYPEIVDALTRHGAQTKTDAQALYRRFGFAGCSPYYENPVPGVVYMRRVL